MAKILATASLVVLALGGTLGGPALQNPQIPNTVEVGAGTQSCGRWVESRGHRSAANDLTTGMIGSWVQGYLTGLALGLDFGAGKSSWAFYPPDAGAIHVWLDGYCKSRPLDSIFTASTQLATELRKR